MQQSQLTNLILDFDSTIVTLETLDELAKIVLAGSPDAKQKATEIARITTRGMNGEIGFAESLALRLAIVMPTKKDVADMQLDLLEAISPSFLRNSKLINDHADNIWIVSGGFTELIIPVAKKFGIDPSHIFANDFTWDTGERATGYDRENPLAQNDGKTMAVRKLNLSPETTCVVGDGMTDYAIKGAGLASIFIAFTETCRRQAVIEKADVVAENFDEVVTHLGWI